ACSSALEVANNPVSKYNPLYIYSKWSSGKTHLLQAIGNEAMKGASHKKAIYLSAENIISRFDKIIAEKSTSFWGKEKPPRFLLLDDFDTVASNKSSQKELLSLCTQFLESKRQLVVAASVPPNQIRNLLPQLRSRLEWGLITEIKTPDQKTKMKLVHQKTKQKGIQFQADATFFLASTTNDLKNLVHQIDKIKIHASLYGNNMDISIVQSILGNERSARINPEHIQDITAKYFGISPSDLLSRNRQRKISYPRQIAIFLTRKYTDLSLEEIGKAFGNKHHSSIIYSINSIEKDLKSKIEVIEDINKIRGFILNGVAL
ncbi:putative chromosomal replication initiator protein DnaA, partial [delta proteobacterium NaphS2]